MILVQINTMQMQLKTPRNYACPKGFPKFFGGSFILTSSSESGADGCLL
jgi:hypothetical protein